MRQVPESILTEWKERFSTLYAAIQAAQSRAELNAIVRKIRKQYEEETLPYPACDGAISAFREEVAGKFVVEVQRSAEEARINRIAYTSTSDGRRRARRWH